MKTREDASETFARLQNAHDDQLIDSNELAVLLRTTRGRVHQLRHSTPEKLPQPLTLFDRRLVWRIGSVREWIRSLPLAIQARAESIEKMDSIADDVDSGKRRPGRPRNVGKGPSISDASGQSVSVREGV
ncbi:hypothetical protein [Burkholderia cepacia]|uniref:hypothetical protein n=1 Tax=Burkholderia cepacia TaxID=292 RepID=UPI001CF3E733|nr:hypothetical protein [Burkholderia cepacia]MCA8349947.1 hypothetical protein [Burkholderia cepacia]